MRERYPRHSQTTRSPKRQTSALERLSGLRQVSTHRGFTIVELLIVVVVIAILAAITIVAYNGITNQANDAVVISNIDQFQKTIALEEASDESRLGELFNISRSFWPPELTAFWWFRLFRP